MLRTMLFGLLIFFSGAIASLHAHKIPAGATEHHLIHKIIENQKHCVTAFEGDKIFIRSETIVPTPQGFCIHLNESELYPLPVLQHEKRGYFIQKGHPKPATQLVASKTSLTKGPCPNCNISTTKSGVCQNIACFLYGLRVL